MIEGKLTGRMGNQMFQYSVTRTIAEKNGYNFYIPSFGDSSICASTEGHHLSNFFPNINMGQRDGDIIYRFNEDHTLQKYDPNIFNLPDFTFVSGFFQTDRYFLENEDSVKSWFGIDMDEPTKKIFDKYPIDEYCFIHLRGSDYRTHTHWFLSKDYYQSAMNRVKDEYSIKFIFVTDDIKSSKEMFPSIEAISNEMMTDFKLIYYSKYCIISNSTFSWWAAWLGNKKITIAPSNWLNYNRPELGFYPIDIKSDKFIYV